MLAWILAVLLTVQALPVAAQAEGDPGTGGGYEVEPGVGEELAPGEASS